MMVIYLPLNFRSSNLIGHSVFELESGNGNVGHTDKNGQMNGRNYINFKRNLAIRVIYLPVKFEFDWTKHFPVKSPETEILRHRQTDQKQTNEHTNFERNLAIMVISLPVKLEFD